MQCPNCQHWNEAGSRFCEECGFELATISSMDAQGANVSVRSAAPSEIPAPAPQIVIPISTTPTTSHNGPRLILRNTGSIFKLGDVAVIGREDATLHIDLDGYPDGKYVSQRHAQITKINDKYYVEDLGSSNHTYVNAIKLAQGQAEPLKSGDIIRIGKLELTFHEN